MHAVTMVTNTNNTSNSAPVVLCDDRARAMTSSQVDATWTKAANVAGHEDTFITYLQEPT